MVKDERTSVTCEYIFIKDNGHLKFTWPEINSLSLVFYCRFQYIIYIFTINKPSCVLCPLGTVLCLLLLVVHKALDQWLASGRAYSN